MRGAFASRFALAAVPLGLAVACGETINVATVPPPDASIRCWIEADAGSDGGADGGGACPEGMFCATTSSCEGSGTCQPVPPPCDEPDTPVCGCNNRTYINECLARQAGINVQFSGRCLSPQGGCSVETRPCPSGSACVFIADVDLGSGFCPTLPSGLVGLCWGVSATCSPSERASFRQICGSGTLCVSECEAIKTGPGRYYDSPTACQ
jgi:hypothetical protein